MKKNFITTGIFLAIVTTVFSQSKNFIDQPYIEVAGYADTLVTPNQIYIKIIISEKDSKDKISVEEQESKMITAFQAMHINTEKNLTTSDMASNYKLYFLKQKDIFKTKEYMLKVSNAATASDVFIQLESLGISNVSIDRVDHSDVEKIKNICRTEAIKNAYNKAVALTKPISQSIGSAIYISDNELGSDNYMQGRTAGISIRGYASMTKQNYEEPKIDFEKIKITATVNVKFILK